MAVVLVRKSSDRPVQVEDCAPCRALWSDERVKISVGRASRHNGTMSVSEPDTIGKYELVREIGAGSMGRVYLARDPFTGRQVAIKVASHKEGSTERGERRRRKLFFNEVKAASMLRHPNIIATFDAGVEDGRRFIVMEYVEGASTLHDFSKPGHLLPIDRVVKVMQECAMAFDYAHSKGVIHRDIKPRNIMLNQQGRVKIGDFGVALIDRDDIEETQVIGRVGSPRYMAPEQLMSDQVTNQADIFSLGVVIYELLTGVSPFADKSVSEIARKILREPHKPLREVRDDVPGDLALIVDRSLKKHPAGRYRTAMELAGDLSSIADEMEMTDLGRMGREAISQIESLPIFYGFETADLADVLAVAVWQTFKPGDVITTEGQGGINTYVLVEGLAEVVCGAIRLTRLGRGSSFGDFGLVESGDQGAVVKAMSECTVMYVGASHAERLAPACAQRFYRGVAADFATRLQQIQRRIQRRKSS